MLKPVKYGSINASKASSGGKASCLLSEREIVQNSGVTKLSLSISWTYVALNCHTDTFKVQCRTLVVYSVS